MRRLRDLEGAGGEVIENLVVNLDMLPAGATLDSDVDRVNRRARFRAIEDGRNSPWSGWFDLDDGPAVLRWRGLWAGVEDGEKR